MMQSGPVAVPIEVIERLLGRQILRIELLEQELLRVSDLHLTKDENDPQKMVSS